jgi:hypothetical protein
LSIRKSDSDLVASKEKIMRRLLSPFVLALLALALVAAGCGSSDSDSAGNGEAAPVAEAEAGGGDGGAPGGADLLASAVEAGRGLQSAHYVLDANLMVASDGSNPQLALFAQGPITLHLEGDASETAFTADASVGFAGQTFSGQVLAGEHEAFFNFMGQWYGTKEAGLADAAERGAEGAVADPQEAIEAVRDKFDDVLTGEVFEGPTVDGAETWRFEGTLDSAGVAALSQEFAGKAMTAEEAAQLGVIADAAKVVVDFGREDNLPRHLEFLLALTADDLAALGGTSDLEGVESLDVSLTIDVSDFGKDVSYGAPAQFAPFEDLFGQLLGLAGAAGA